MTKIKLHNTKTRKREEFVPIDPDNVRMYLCGPTVYDRAHLGNARPVLVFDVLKRLLRHVYGEDSVTYVRNFTDVDDRINETAQKRKAEGAEGTLEELIHERSNETIAWYHADMDALGAARPDHEPRATEYIAKMISMIEELIAKGHAYAAEGHVLFAVDSWRENYGKLSGRSVDDMIAGARVEVAPYKRNPMDFVMWKPSPEGLPGWDSPWGKGRPGWHIECSAMADELLWEKPLAEGRLNANAKENPHVFDIHGGGNDLMFPHHENEIAQSCCANGTDKMANIWMHNEMLQVEGKKMSKSLGNFFTVRDLLDQGVPGEVIRFVMLSTHYRKPMDWTEKKREEAERTLKKWYALAATALDAPAAPEFFAVLGDDLNTAGALAYMHTLAGQGNAGALAGALSSLGFLDENIPEWATPKLTYTGGLLVVADIRVDQPTEPVLECLKKWREFRETKNYAEADALKMALSQLGIDLVVKKEGLEAIVKKPFDAAKLEALK